MTSMAFH